MAAINHPTHVVSYDLKEDMGDYLVTYYGFSTSEEGPLGTVQVNGSWFTWPYTFGSVNPLCLRTWYVLKDGNGEITGMAAQTWLSLILFRLPVIHWLMTKIFGDLKYSANYTLWNGAGQQIGYIDGRMISLGIKFDLYDRWDVIAANVRIGSDHRYANIYRKETEGKIGEIKVDCETRERGDYKVSFCKGEIDPRIIQIFSSIAVDQALIAVEKAGESPLHVDAA